jgi:hypothetical protein
MLKSGKRPSEPQPIVIAALIIAAGHGFKALN